MPCTESESNMSSQPFVRHCVNCGLNTWFQQVTFENGWGLQCLTCGKRWVAHYCTPVVANPVFGGLQASEPEWLPLLIDFGINKAFDAYCPGCRQEINVLHTAADMIRPYNPQASNLLDQLANGLAFFMLAVTAVGVGGWIARQFD